MWTGLVLWAFLSISETQLCIFLRPRGYATSNPGRRCNQKHLKFDGLGIFQERFLKTCKYCCKCIVRKIQKILFSGTLISNILIQILHRKSWIIHQRFWCCQRRGWMPFRKHLNVLFISPFVNKPSNYYSRPIVVVSMFVFSCVDSDQVFFVCWTSSD